MNMSKPSSHWGKDMSDFGLFLISLVAWFLVRVIKNSSWHMGVTCGSRAPISTNLSFRIFERNLVGTLLPTRDPNDVVGRS